MRSMCKNTAQFIQENLFELEFIGKEKKSLDTFSSGTE